MQPPRGYTVLLSMHMLANAMKSVSAGSHTCLPTPAQPSQIAKERGCTAVHPGYGFLSENESFCQACSEAGIVWLGPSVETMHNFSLKHVARALAEEAGVSTARLCFPLFSGLLPHLLSMSRFHLLLACLSALYLALPSSAYIPVGHAALRTGACPQRQRSAKQRTGGCGGCRQGESGAAAAATRPRYICRAGP